MQATDYHIVVRMWYVIVKLSICSMRYYRFHGEVVQPGEGQVGRGGWEVAKG